MSRPTVAISILAGLAALIPATATAQAPPVAANSTATLVSTAPAVSLYVVPNGSGRPLVSCFAYGGTTVGASVNVTLVGTAMLPAPFVPVRDVRIGHLDPGLSWCPDVFYPPLSSLPNCADVPSTPVGTTFFNSITYHGGGWNFGGVHVYVLEASGAYMPIQPALPVHINSPDINGDLIVNLSDIVLFVSDLSAGAAPYRSDFNWDGTINLSDIVMLAQAIGTTCP